MALDTTWLEKGARDGQARLELVVLGPEVCTAIEVKGAEVLLVGRDPAAQVRLLDAAVSVRHARLHITADGGMLVEDLGSKNGTLVSGAPAGKGARVAVAPGEAVTIGATTIVLQRRNVPPRARRVWPYGYLEARLEEQCAMFEGTGATFAVVRVDGDDDVASARVAELLAPALRLADVIAAYAPRVWEILLPYATPEEAGAVSTAVEKALGRGGVKARTALAVFPRDGRTPAALIQHAARQVRGKSGGAPVPDLPVGTIVEDEEMRRVFETARKMAVGEISVLLQGETGVGKEVVAEAIHRASVRSAKPYLCLNCAAVTETLLENELFGHEKDAFSGATQMKKGLLESAKGGTVFLDEVAEMSPALQAKLLRAIETKIIMRVGGVEPVSVNVRFIAATRRDLPREVAAERFRTDLYFRLAGATLTIPPLRRRKGEIRIFAEAFLKASARQLGRPTPRLSKDALAALEAYAWPGNVRELRNYMERALLLADGPQIDLEQLPMEMLGAPLAFVADPETLRADGDDARDKWNRAEREERARIVSALERAGGNQTRAAEDLGISRGTLISRMKYYEIRRPHDADGAATSDS